MKNKKGVELLSVVITALILLVVAIVVIVIFRNLTGKQATGIKQEIELGFGDYDKDQVADRFDACLCNPGEISNDGCPYSVKPDASNTTSRFFKCSTEFCEQYGVTGCPDKPTLK